MKELPHLLERVYLAAKSKKAQYYILIIDTDSFQPQCRQSLSRKSVSASRHELWANGRPTERTSHTMLSTVPVATFNTPENIFIPLKFYISPHRGLFLLLETHGSLPLRPWLAPSKTGHPREPKLRHKPFRKHFSQGIVKLLSNLASVPLSEGPNASIPSVCRCPNLVVPSWPVRSNAGQKGGAISFCAWPDGGPPQYGFRSSKVDRISIVFL